MISFPRCLCRKHARISVGVVAAFACLAPLTGLAAAAPTVYVHLGQESAREKYREKPMRKTHQGKWELDKHTCGHIWVDEQTGIIRVSSRVRGKQIRYRQTSKARFISGRLTTEKPVPMIGLLAQVGWAHRSDAQAGARSKGFQSFEICAKHHNRLARKVRRLPKIHWRDMRIETWESWKKANPVVAGTDRQATLNANKARLFAVLQGSPWRESNYRMLVDAVCSYWQSFPGHENHATCSV